MKVLLVNPEIKNGYYSYPPMSLGYIGSFLKMQKIDVKILDLNHILNNLIKTAEKRDVIRLLYICIKDFQPDIIGFTAWTIQYPEARRLIEEVKDVLPNVKTVLGGHHAGSMIHQTLKENPELDYVVYGEGELPMLKLAKYHKVNMIENLAYRTHDEIRVNPRKFIEDPDMLPFAWHTLNPVEYSKGNVHGFQYKELPIAPIMTSRGCPYGCTYCGARNVHGRKLRFRSAKNCIDEIEYLVDCHGIKEIQIIDDNFAFDKQHAMDFCNELMDRKLDIVWNAISGLRIDRVDEEVLQTMWKAGCYAFSVGIEFGSKRILQRVHKALDLDIAEKNIKLASKMGFKISGYFIIGERDETKEDVEETINFASRVPLSKAQFGFLVPLPNTPIFNELVSEGVIDPANVDWEGYDISSFKQNINKHMSMKELQSLRRKAHLKFYFSNYRYFGILRSIHDLTNMKQIAKYAWKTVFP